MVAAYFVVVPAAGVLEVTPEPMSVPDAVPVVPEAPMEVPLPVVEPMLLEPAVVSVVLLPVVEPAVVLEVSAGDVVVDGVVVLDEEVAEVSAGAASSRLPQADRDRAATTARAAACAIGDLIIRNSLEVSFRARKRQPSLRCLRFTLVVAPGRLVVSHCRSL
jgi:hypothetical protein